MQALDAVSVVGSHSGGQEARRDVRLGYGPRDATRTCTGQGQHPLDLEDLDRPPLVPQHATERWHCKDAHVPCPREPSIAPAHAPVVCGQAGTDPLRSVSF